MYDDDGDGDDDDQDHDDGGGDDARDDARDGARDDARHGDGFGGDASSSQARGHSFARSQKGSVGAPDEEQQASKPQLLYKTRQTVYTGVKAFSLPCSCRRHSTRASAIGRRTRRLRPSSSERAHSPGWSRGPGNGRDGRGGGDGGGRGGGGGDDAVRVMVMLTLSNICTTSSG